VEFQGMKKKMRMKREIFQDDSVFHTSRVLNCPKFMTPS
jgi:hypothetical protein